MEYIKTYFVTILLFLLSQGCINAQKEAKDQRRYYEKLEFRNLGPWRGGRSCAVAGLKDDINTYYMGSTGGGIWKTTDGGNSWKNISDGFFGGSIGAIAIADADPNVIYVGTGENTIRGNVSSGHGLWKSVDEGLTWTFIGLDSSFHISRIRIDPQNPDIVFIAVMGNLYKDSSSRGIYKSKDGGQSWRKVLYIQNNVGISDLIMDPNNCRRMYACSWNFRRTPYSLSSGGPGSGLWQSTDKGETWTSISKNKGLPKGIWGISGITASPAKKGRLWVIIENDKGGVFRSDDYGKTWIKTNSDRNLRQRAWYYSKIYADTEDPNVVYILNVGFHKSNDAGKKFKRIRTPHGDHHDLWIDPNNASRMIIGDDGGAQVSTDGGMNWTTYMNQPTAQFYRVTTDNTFPFRVYAAQQDNSAIRINHRSDRYGITKDDWERTAGGESGYLAPDPKNSDIVYGGSYGGYLTKYNHKTKQSRAVNVWPDNPLGAGAEVMKYRFNWNFPIQFSKHDSNKLFAGSNHLHITTNEGQSWQTISGDLTRNDSAKLKSSGGPITQDNTSVEYYGTLQAIAESPISKNILWTGSDDGLIHLSKDNGQSWVNTTTSNIPKWTLINSIEPDPRDSAACFITATSYKSGDFQPYIYHTNDYGKHWRKLVKGITNDHFVRVVRIDPKQPNILFAGTERGLYISTNSGRNWNAFQLNLPIVPITDITIHDPFLIIATQGRGLWILDDLTLLRQIYSHPALSDIMLFKPKLSYRMKGGQSKHVKGMGINHAAGVTVHFYIDSMYIKDSVQLIFSTKEKEVIRQFSTFSKEKADKLKIQAGANHFVWNMRYPSAKKFDGMILWWASLSGAKVLPDTYGVQLIVGKDTLRQSFDIQLDPRLPSSKIALKAKFDFIQKNNDALSRAHTTVTSIRAIRKQLKEFVHKTKEHPANSTLDSMATRIDSLMTCIENNLYQTKVKSSQDPINFPIKLTNKLGHLNSLISGGEYAPTQQEMEVQKILISAIDLELQHFEQIKEKDLKEVNQFIRDKKIDAISIPEVID